MENIIDTDANIIQSSAHTAFSTLLTIQQKLNQELALKEISNHNAI